MASSRAFFSYRRSLRALRNPNLEKPVVCYHTSGRLVEESLETKIGFFLSRNVFCREQVYGFSLKEEEPIFGWNSTGGRNLRRKMLLVGDKTETKIGFFLSRNVFCREQVSGISLKDKEPIFGWNSTGGRNLRREMLLVGDKTEKVHFSSKSEAGDGGSGKAGDGGDGGSGKAGDGGSGKADDGGSGKADDGGSGKADDGGSGKADDGGSGKADDGGSGKADDGGSGKADDGGSGKADDGGSGKADDGGSGEADDGGDGGSGKADGGGSGKADDGGSGQADDGGSEDDYKPNEDPQSTWFKVVKLLITRFVYKVAKRSCERSVNRQKKFISFMNASQAHKLHLLKKATGKDSEFVKYTGLKEACRDFAETYTSFLIWLALGSFTLISTGWELHSSSQMEKGLASLRVEMNNNNSVVSEVKKEMTSKDASYMHRFEEITRISNQKLEDLEKKIDLLLASKK